VVLDYTATTTTTLISISSLKYFARKLAMHGIFFKSPVFRKFCKICVCFHQTFLFCLNIRGSSKTVVIGFDIGVDHVDYHTSTNKKFLSVILKLVVSSFSALANYNPWLRGRFYLMSPPIWKYAINEHPVQTSITKR
jgi:hypothetical protein